LNIDDVLTKDIVIPQGNLFAEIFKLQHDLAVKYGPIERKNGFYVPEVDSPPHIDDAQFQNWIKNMFWRVAEELAEAMENPCAYSQWRTLWDTDSDVRHFLEEVADALHFLVEVSLMFDVSADWLNEMWESVNRNETVVVDSFVVSRYCWRVILQMGLAANTLKNKPWKNTQMPTDQEKFIGRLFEAWKMFLHLFRILGMSDQEIYVLYSKKHKVNEFRQTSNY
jgi:dimeric dUTPase (all-alpha-NTP-PPase superfamily)